MPPSSLPPWTPNRTGFDPTYRTPKQRVYTTRILCFLSTDNIGKITEKRRGTPLIGEHTGSIASSTTRSFSSRCFDAYAGAFSPSTPTPMTNSTDKNTSFQQHRLWEGSLVWHWMLTQGLVCRHIVGYDSAAPGRRMMTSKALSVFQMPAFGDATHCTRDTPMGIVDGCFACFGVR